MRPHASTLRGLVMATGVAFLLGLPAYTSGEDQGGARSRGGSSTGGQARARAGSDSGDGGHVSSAGGGSGSGGGHVSSSGSGSGGGRVFSTPRSLSSPGVRSAPQPSPTGGNGAPDANATSRPRDDRLTVGQAVPRPPDSPARPDGGKVVIVSPSYYGSYYRGYYGGYYPWGYGGLGLGGYYGWYDPWRYDRGYYGRSYSSAYEGGLRLRVKPSHAEVFVDGYYAGIVDEFDNSFQRLRLETGPHRIEVRANGYEPLTFEVKILPDHTVTYRGELRRVP